jgi:unspecific monooxygenase
MATDATPIAFNPFDPSYRSDPYGVLNKLRDTDPVHVSPLGFTALSRYADCAMILRHPAASSDDRKARDWPARVREQGLDPDQVLLDSTLPFLFMDPPDHTRLRGLVTKAFTPRVIENLRPRVEAIVRELLDAAGERGGSIEIIEELAYPLPVVVISEMLGVPREDNETFKGWSREMARSLDPEFVLPPEVNARREKAVSEFRDYMVDLIAKRRARPGDDLLSALIAAEEEGSKLTEAELLSTAILLLIAGHETTVNLIGNGTLALLRNPDQMQRLRDDPSLIKTAIEELLRFDPPVQLTGRYALEDIEISDRVIPKDTQTILLLGAANRDPAQFADPERLDIGRADNRHLAFGMGIHFCLGAPLARIEGQIAIGEFVRRVEAPRLVEDPPPYKENITLRGIASLPVAFDDIRA